MKPTTRREVDPPGFRCLGWAWRCCECDAVRARHTPQGWLVGGRRPADCAHCGQREGGFDAPTVYACERCGRWVYHNETSEHREGCEG